MRLRSHSKHWLHKNNCAAFFISTPIRFCEPQNNIDKEELVTIPILSINRYSHLKKGTG